MKIGKEKSDKIGTIIGHNAHFEGTISSNQGLRIDGSVKGKIQCEGTLIVGSEGNVEAEIVANNVLIAGEFAGNVIAKNHLEITEKGKVRGEITTANLVMAPGVVFDGACHMTSHQDFAATKDSLSLPAPMTPSFAS
jgi:cytoskeletal protein CcmA (bactofilin family)